MKNARVNFLFLACFTLSCIFSGCSFRENREVLFQVSTFDSLMAGKYDASYPYSKLSRKGDFGLGTFEALDGEMAAIDGVFYQIDAGCRAHQVSGTLKTPFAAVTYFDTDRKYQLKDVADYKQLLQALDNLIPDKNIFYAVKVEGVFKHLKLRSVPAQKKPYVPLLEALKNQTVKEYNDISGVMIGFRCPETVNGVNVPGYHFHFLNSQRTEGGHVLECDFSEALAFIDETKELGMILP